MYHPISSTGFKPVLFPQAKVAPKFAASSGNNSILWDSDQDADFEYDSFGLTTPEDTFHQPPKPDMQELERKFKAFWNTLEKEHAAHNHDPAQCPNNGEKPALRRQPSFLEALKAEVADYREKKKKLSPELITENALLAVNDNTSKPSITEEEKPAYKAFGESRFTQTTRNRILFNPSDTPAKPRKTEATYIPNREPNNPSRRNSFAEAVTDEVREIRARKNKLVPDDIADSALETINKNAHKQPLSPEKAEHYKDSFFKQDKKRTIFTLDN